MSTINDGGPAFPSPACGDWSPEYGMMLRDWFAGKFLVGAAGDNTPLDVSVAADQYDVDAALMAHWGAVARAAYIAADAMLAARSGGAS